MIIIYDIRVLDFPFVDKKKWAKNVSVARNLFWPNSFLLFRSFSGVTKSRALAPHGTKIQPDKTYLLSFQWVLFFSNCI